MAKAKKQEMVKAPANSGGLLTKMGLKYDIDPKKMKSVLEGTIVPKGCTEAQFIGFLVVADQYDLNPFIKEIYAFPAKGGGIQPIVGVDGWNSLANRQEAYDGLTTEFSHDEDGKLVSCTAVVHRKDRKYPTTATEFLVECKRSTDTWRNMPHRMLAHCARIQAIRTAFGFGGLMDPDEGETIRAVDCNVVDDDLSKPGRHSLRKKAPAPSMELPVVDAKVAEKEPEPSVVEDHEPENDTSPEREPGSDDDAEQGNYDQGAMESFEDGE